MRARSFPALFLLLLLLAAPLRAGDTTYSDTRSVPRQGPVSKAPEGGGGGGTGGGSEEPVRIPGPFVVEDDEEDYLYRPSEEEDRAPQTFLGACLSPGKMHSLGDVGFFLLTITPRLGICFALDRLGSSHADLFTGSADMQALSRGPWRLGFGFGLGPLYMPGAAGGADISLHAEALRVLSSGRQVRIRAGVLGVVAVPSVDYERTILVDGNPVGYQHDHLTSYVQGGYPVTVEGLWSGSHGLYLAGGAGAMRLSEEVDYLRTRDGGNTWETYEESRTTIRPLATLGVGRFASRDGGRRFQRFEIRYQAAFLLPDRRSSFPGDNSQVVHSLTWDWGWLW